MAKVRRALPRAGVLACALVAVLAMGCGGDDNDNGAEGSTATNAIRSVAAGEPIKVGTIAPIGGETDYPDIAGAAEAAIEAVNARGGVVGRPLELIVCNEGDDPNKASACARRMVSEGVIATVGDLSASNETQISAILTKAGIPQIGTTPLDAFGKAESSFPIAPAEALTFFAQMKLAADAGHRRIGTTLLDIPVAAELLKAMEAFAPKIDVKITSRPPLAVDTTDMASVVATLDSQADAAILIALDAQKANALKAAKQVGSDLAFVLDTTSTFASLEALSDDDLEGQLVVSIYPPMSAVDDFPELQRFRDEMQAGVDAGIEGAPTDEIVRHNAISAWLAVQVLEQVANDAKATDAKAMMQALEESGPLDLGLVPPWTPSKKGVGDYPRASNTTFYFNEMRDGVPVLLDDVSQPVDIGPLVR